MKGAYVATNKVTLPSMTEMLSGLFGFTGYASRKADYRTPSSSDDNECWLRSAAPSVSDPTIPLADFVDYDGHVDPEGNRVSFALGVRPASQISLNRIIFKSVFDPSSAAAGGTFSNPFMLYCVSRDVTSVGLSVNADKLTVSFDQRAAYAYQSDTESSPDNLKNKFTVMNGATPINITGAAIVNGKIVLTLDKTFTNGEDVSGVTVQYTSAAADTYGIGLPESRQSVKSVASGVSMSGVTNTTPAPPPPPPPPPSSATTPSNVRVTIDGTTYLGERTGETFTITVPYGTDISNLDIAGNLPAGATSDPKLPAKHDFTQGPLELVVTVEDGTKKTYTVNVIVESPVGPIERALFAINVADCEIIVTQNTDGTLAVKVRIPFASSSNPALLDTVKMIANSLGLTNISYVWVDGQGKETPVARMAASAPYLEIRGTAANMDAVKDGAITSIQYTLTGDSTTYVQTFANGGLKVAGMPGYPSPEPTPGGGSSGCDAGRGGGAGCGGAGGLCRDRQAEKLNE